MRTTKADLQLEVAGLQRQVGLLQGENADLAEQNKSLKNQCRQLEQAMQTMAKQYGDMVTQVILSEFGLEPENSEGE